MNNTRWCNCSKKDISRMIQTLQGADISKDYTGTVRKKNKHNDTVLKYKEDRIRTPLLKEDLEKGEYSTGIVRKR